MAIETQDKATTAPAESVNGLDAKNTAMETKIGEMYDAQRKANMAQLESGYNQNIAEIDRSQGKISDQFNEQRNQLASQYQMNKRNLNMEAAANGLNTGAHSQMDLGQANAYLSAYNNLGKQEQEQNADYENKRMTLMQTYQSDIAKAAADNDAQKAAALLDEYNNQRNNAMQQAGELAKFGDFSMYENLYGTEAANMMRRGWAMQNPDQAWSLGYITAAEYKALTGVDPHNMSQATIDDKGYYTGQNSINNQTQASSGGGGAGWDTWTPGYTPIGDGYFEGPTGQIIYGGF